MVRQGVRVSTGAKQQQRIDPKIVLSSHILQLSQFELEQAIETELMENPALERIDDFEAPTTHDEILKVVAPAELRPNHDNNELRRSLPQDGGNEVDWVDLAASCDSLWDHLLAQLQNQLDDRHGALIQYMVGSVNERGYLTCSVEEAALDCNSSLEDAQDVFEALRRCEPAGVGAVNLQDCLFLQLRDAKGDPECLARAMLKRDWDDLVNRNSRAISRKYQVDDELVKQAFEVILRLNPFPGETFETHSAAPVERSVQALPDVVITLDEIGWLVEVPGPSPISLRVSSSYSKRVGELDNRTWSDPEKKHVHEFVSRAQRFIDALGQRRQQLARIGKFLVERQGGFVKTGEYRFLLPLTRSQVAKDLGLHESTVSRATAGKFIQLATKDVVPFDVFFKPALRVQKMIEEILATENPASPLSDEGIAEILARKGIKVARRTVNKYRDRTKLLSSRMRRMA